MGRKGGGGPERNPTPRVERELSPRQEAFVLALLGGASKIEAVREAGYEVGSDAAARCQAARLLRTASVKVAMERARLKAVERMDRTAEATLLRYHHVYVEAMEAKDFSAAVAALRDIGKAMNLFQAHQKAKYTQADIPQLQRQLEQAGFDFTRVNDPVEHLTDAERAEQVASLERKKAEAERRLAELKAAGNRRTLLNGLQPGSN